MQSCQPCYGIRNRYQIMSYEQVVRLTSLLSDTLEISAVVDEFESVKTSEWCLRDIIQEIQRCLMEQNISVKDIRLIGGAAAYVIEPSSTVYSDVDLLFRLNSHCASLDDMDRVRAAVLRAVTLCSQCPAELLVTKQVCVPCGAAPRYQQQHGSHHQSSPHHPHLQQQQQQYWSLFSLGQPLRPSSQVVELKFAASGSLQRHYECSVDSFQLVLDPVLHYLSSVPQLGTTESTATASLLSRDLYPTSVLECTWGCVKTGLRHLCERIIRLDRPEALRGGGLLKFCKLRVHGYNLDTGGDEASLKKLMCARFFIDFPLLGQQQQKILSYLDTHFPRNYKLYVDFLETVSETVLTSSSYIEVDKVRLSMLVRDLAVDIRRMCQQHQQQHKHDKCSISVNQFDDSLKWRVDEITQHKLPSGTKITATQFGSVSNGPGPTSSTSGVAVFYEGGSSSCGSCISTPSDAASAAEMDDSLSEDLNLPVS